MQLVLHEATADSIRAGYECPCGCRPSVTYGRNGAAVNEGCCCGNEFAVGPHATATLEPKPGYRVQSTSFSAPWGETIEAFWLIGPSVHGEATYGEHEGGVPDGSQGHDHEAHGEEAEPQTHIDPVCGMLVEAGTAEAKVLWSTHHGHYYYFCGRGCKLDFDEDPRLYLDPSYVPSM